jgi:hypothetical protein
MLPISSILLLPIALGKLNNLTYFYASLIPLPSLLRPNYILEFKVFDDIKPLLIKSLSPFVYNLWATLLERYLGKLLKLINNIIIYRYKIGFKKQYIYYILKNLSIVLLDALKITIMLWGDLELGQVILVDGNPPFIYFLLRFVLKLDGKL